MEKLRSKAKEDGQAPKSQAIRRGCCSQKRMLMLSPSVLHQFLLQMPSATVTTHLSLPHCCSNHCVHRRWVDVPAHMQHVCMPWVIL